MHLLFLDWKVKIYIVYCCWLTTIVPRSRGYSDDKLQENLDSEIFEVLLEEARGAYDEDIVVELNSETDGEIESNCERIVAWIDAWKKQQAETAD